MLIACAAWHLMPVARAAAPGVISIDFVGTGPAMGATESAGVVAKTNWNNATGASRTTPLALKDETGATTTATITWTSNNAWSTPITDQPGNRRMMKGYLDQKSQSATTVTVAGLPVAPYDVYVYADGDNAAVTRTGGYRISGAGITTTTINLTDAANANFNATFTQANNSTGNYVKFSNITPSGGGFTLTATPGASSNGTKRAPVNGIQIVPTAPPPPPPPDFTIAAAPASRTVTQGTGTSYTVTIGAVNGFAGVVNLTAGGLPADATASFTPASVTGGGTATLDVTTSATTPTGSPTITITGTSAALTHATTVSVVVTAPPSPDFTIAATPTSQTITQGTSTTYTVGIGAVNGFSGAVTLSAGGLPANATASFSPASIAGSGSATLNVTTAASTPAGTSTLTVTGTSGALAHAATVSLTVNAVSTGRTISVDFVGNGTAMGAAESAGVVPKANWNNATGATQPTAASLKDETGAATSATITWTSDNVWSTPIGDQPGNQRFMKGYLDNGSGGAVTITVAGLAADNYDVYVYADGDNSGATRTGGYRISGTGITTTTINLTDPINTNFTGTFVQADNSNGNYVKFSGIAPASGGFTVTATPGPSSNGVPRAPVNGIQIVPGGPPPPPPPPPADFTIAAAPASQTVTPGAGASYTVTIGALNGFSSDVTLSVSGLPANTTATFTPASIAAAGASTLDVATTANTPGGNATLTITGTSASLSHTAAVTLMVAAPTFSLTGAISPAANGASAKVDLGGTAVATTTADASGTFSFSGLFNGPYAVMPSKPGFTFSPTSQNPTINGADVTGVNFTATPAPITVSITSPAEGAALSRTFSINASGSAGVVAVQFQVDGANAGPEDTSAPFTVSLTAPSGPHVLTAVGRDATGTTVVSSPVNVTVNAGAGTALTVNGGQTFQTIDGFGVNINSLSWKNGEMRPAIDMLVDQMGVTLWRVVFDMEDWEDPNDDLDPTTPNWAYYTSLYSNAKFQNLWGTLRYLNQKGITTGILLSFMGRVPPWMGGSHIDLASEDEWVEMMATLCHYAKNVENVQFDMLDPLNEPDWDGFEGPIVDQWQYTRLLEKLSVKLDAMGLSALRFVGPNTAQITTGVNTYMPQMMTSSIVMSKVDHFGFHNYGTNSGGADAAIKGSAFPNKNFWITEVWNPSDVMGHIGQNPGGVMVWDALDSVYNHAILAGRGTTPPNDNDPGLPPLAYNTTTGTYTPRDTFYQHAQIQKYVPRGSIRIAATESNANLTIYAFRDPVSGRLTLVGRNIGASSIAINGTLSGIPAVNGFQFYQTDVSGNQFKRGTDAVVTNGAFVFTAPVNSYFTLTAAGTP